MLLQYLLDGLNDVEKGVLAEQQKFGNGEVLHDGHNYMHAAVVVRPCLQSMMSGSFLFLDSVAFRFDVYRSPRALCGIET